ncbi:MAG: 30S ribosomal protein S20 [Myxococcales bacterium]|nr:30S ribosomal protein S20 [Myxococcales bacterium]
MPNHKSAEKRAKQNEKRRLRNRLVMVSMRTFIKKVRRALDNGDVAEAREALPSAIRHLERAAAKGVIHRNQASRKVGRLMVAVNKATSAQQAS